jgi:hypothetical protein
MRLCFRIFINPKVVAPGARKNSGSAGIEARGFFHRGQQW